MSHSLNYEPLHSLEICGKTAICVLPRTMMLITVIIAVDRAELSLVILFDPIFHETQGRDTNKAGVIVRQICRGGVWRPIRRSVLSLWLSHLLLWLCNLCILCVVIKQHCNSAQNNSAAYCQSVLRIFRTLHFCTRNFCTRNFRARNFQVSSALPSISCSLRLRGSFYIHLPHDMLRLFSHLAVARCFTPSVNARSAVHEICGCVLQTSAAHLLILNALGVHNLRRNFGGC
mmetsp:Transcript_1900/g.3911  ORF Transcript_1900/g.3911 Transcript_1900/m.3911 type:complete len:231 (+) Transcript_1900:1520-2212(+)